MRPDWCKDWKFWEHIRYFAGIHGIDADLIAALIQTESSGEPWSCRYEPLYKWVYGFETTESFAQKIGVSVETNFMMQRTSWGLCHVMGGVFYEHGGYNEEGNPLLMLKPEVSIKYAALHLKQKMRKYGDDPATLYAAYNAGIVAKTDGGLFQNQRHVDNFMRYHREIKEIE